MKKLILVLLMLLLTGCAPAAAGDDAPPPPDPADAAPLPVDEGETVSLDYLGLEFAPDDFDPQTLLALARDLSPALQAQLALRGYDVAQIGCTIGSANLMTAQALNDGGVQVAFLPTDAYAELCYDKTRVVLAASNTDHLTHGLFAGSSAYGEKLVKKAALTWADFDKARWGVLPPGDVSRAYASLYLADNCEGSTLDMLSHLTVYETEAALAAAAEAGEVDIAALPYSQTLPRLAETEEVYSAVVAVSRANATLSSDSFVRALRESLTAVLSQDPALFSPYRIHALYAAQDADLDPARRLLTITQ